MRVFCCSSVAPVLQLFTGIGSTGECFSVVVLSVQPAYRNTLTSVQPVLCEFILQSLWTTAPAFKLDFARSSGAYRRLNRRCSNLNVGSTGERFSSVAGSVHRLNRRGAPVHVGSTGVYTVCIFQQLCLAVCFHITSRLFLGLFCVSVAPL